MRGAAPHFIPLTVLLTFLSALGGFPAQARQAPSQKADFASVIQPLLKAHCYPCHSGTQQQGGLRLDARQFLLRGGVSGAAIVPGNSGASLLTQRICGQGGGQRMPVGFAPLTEPQIQQMRVWINAGAPWAESGVKKRWAYMKPTAPRLPKVKNAAWTRSPIDAFVLAKLEANHLQPSPEADKVTLIRRVTLDLTGLSPTPQEVDAFLADKTPKAYVKVVDRLLASPHYGERMALPWLDAARYADSNGFQQDGDTYQYVWRDWVVRALNQNMPFDQFTLQQIAGDLLPNPTTDQIVATGFNRCHLLNGEGGAIPEEQRNVILFDRVDVTATTWLGATMACAQCHDHKYDPITQRDYYAFMAYFNRVPESGVPSGSGPYRVADPWIYAGSPAEMAKLKDFEAQIAAAKTEAENYTRSNAAEIEKAQAQWAAESLRSGAPTVKRDSWQAVGPFPAASFDAAYAAAFGPEKQRLSADLLTQTYQEGRLKWVAHPEWEDGKSYVLTGENSAFYLYRVLHADRPGPLALSFGSDDAIKVWLNGAPLLEDKTQRAVAPDQEKANVTLLAGENRLLIKIVNGGGIGGFYFNALQKGIPDAIQVLLKTPPAPGSADATRLRDYFLSAAPPAPLKALQEKIRALEIASGDYRKNLPKVMVMSDAQPRKTHLLLRGNYETPGEEVSPATPGFLPAPPPDAPKNRLGLARWLVSPDNPLTARVQVNRYWQLFFGAGLVKTSENLGTQCEPPVYPALLDWLAVTFRESGWDVKRMHRLIVTSATYRQSSKVSPALRLRDPENRLLARAARFRLPSLLLRDVALASSGLLNPALGGKPVYPYQPKGIWDGLAITNERDFTYPQSKGDDLYRRSLYTFWRRTVAPANMFDSSPRTTCRVRLPITSAPMYALTTLNDATWVEAGRALAQNVMLTAGKTPDARLKAAFRRVCARAPAPDELRILERNLQRALAYYRAQPAAAAAYLTAGESPRSAALAPAEHAAYASVCLIIYNLDEALTRE